VASGTWLADAKPVPPPRERPAEGPEHPEPIPHASAQQAAPAQSKRQRASELGRRPRNTDTSLARQRRCECTVACSKSTSALRPATSVAATTTHLIVAAAPQIAHLEAGSLITRIAATSQQGLAACAPWRHGAAQQCIRPRSVETKGSRRDGHLRTPGVES